MTNLYSHSTGMLLQLFIFKARGTYGDAKAEITKIYAFKTVSLLDIITVN